MRVFAIRDEERNPEDLAGYLIYYERPGAFYIELPDHADPWETPLLLASFAKRGETSVNSYWSRIWVEQRIVPRDRQNIARILSENNLPEYDEFSLLLLTMGRCEQDSFYLEELHDIPPLLARRWTCKLEDVVPLENRRLLGFFRNGEVRITEIAPLAESHPELRPYLANDDRFCGVEVQPDGYGVFWSDQAVLSDRELFHRGREVPLSLRDFCSFVTHRVINATEACGLLDCSRQNIDDLVRRGKLHPIRRDAKYKLFLRNEVVQRKRG